MKETKCSKIEIVLSFVLIIALLVYAIANAPLMTKPLEQLKQDGSFKNFIDHVHSAYVSDDLVGKNDLIHINGAFARATNRRIYNNVALLKNGMLASSTSYPVDITGQGEALVELSNFVESQDGHFLYVQAGNKADLPGETLLTGMTDYNDENADHLLAFLKAAQVNCLDLRPVLNADAEALEKYYFKTDHHWNFDGAFVGFGMIAEKLSELVEGQPLDCTYTDPQMWNTYVLKDHFLGSRGKRVGKYYAGVDDVKYYTPKFDTDMSFTVHRYNSLVKGTFEETVMQSEYLERTDYMTTNPYALYIGGDYPLVFHRNDQAPNDMKVLMIKDSYTLPVQAFMSTLFSEIDVIDPRHFSESTIIEYVDQHDFDLVIFMVTTSSLAMEVYTTSIGTDDHTEKELTIVADIGRIVLPADNAGYNFQAIPLTLEANKQYRLHIGSVDVLEGEAEAAVIRVYDFAAKQTLQTITLDIEYISANDGFTWYFTIPDTNVEDIGVLLYSGIVGKTEGISLAYNDVTVSQVD